MARNEEKAQSMLSRFLQAKNEEKKKPKERRPFLASECRDLADADKWRQQIIREIGRKVMDIQNPGLGEHRLRDLNDEINKLIREKGHWEARILELGGPNYAKTAPKVTDEDGKEVRKEEPVVARCLSLCAWECDWFHFSCVTWICGAVCLQGSVPPASGGSNARPIAMHWTFVSGSYGTHVWGYDQGRSVPHSRQPGCCTMSQQGTLYLMHSMIHLCSKLSISFRDSTCSSCNVSLYGFRV